MSYIIYTTEIGGVFKATRGGREQFDALVEGREKTILGHEPKYMVLVEPVDNYDFITDETRPEEFA